jgi:hypothetical protein
VAQSGQAVNTGDATSLEWYDPQIDSHFPGSQLCVPVIDSHGNVFAVIQLAEKENAIMFDEADEGQLRRRSAQGIHQHLRSGTGELVADGLYLPGWRRGSRSRVL